MINLNYHAPTSLEKVLFPLLYYRYTIFDDKNTFSNKIQTYKMSAPVHHDDNVYVYNKCKIVNHTINFKTNVVQLLSSLHTI